MAEESQTLCGLYNGRLPEIYSAEQNVAVFAQMVPIYVQVDGRDRDKVILELLQI
jgi:hypothetical protein